MAESFLNLTKKKVTQVQERQTVQMEMKPNRPTPRHIKIKLAKSKGKENLKGHERESVTYPQKAVS